jgi:hypothetical protein
MGFKTTAQEVHIKMYSSSASVKERGTVVEQHRQLGASSSQWHVSQSSSAHSGFLGRNQGDRLRL